MFHKTVLKWFIISLIVITSFLVVLLLLGYLLKENEIKVTQLKIQLEQEAFQQQHKRQQSRFNLEITETLTATEKSQKQIIDHYTECQSDKQCFVVQTNSPAIGCTVAVNTTGAVILLKVSAVTENKKNVNNQCLHEYQKANKIMAQCKNNKCSL